MGRFLKQLFVLILVFLTIGIVQAEARYRSYINSNSVRVHAPNHRDRKHQVAVCRDGTTSHSYHRRGTRSRHGGVRTWLRA
ncbi:DUF3761 domain-containing protein [Labrys sp. La1]|uniref:DUF3761 domain-containing protein n=1 Tax=Labrys sp. La1 TaxID=3404917 RepID=UPI003EBDFA0D